LPFDFAFWRDYNHAMLRHAEMLYVLETPGWWESAGVMDEIDFAKAVEIPVVVTKFPLKKGAPKCPEA